MSDSDPMVQAVTRLEVAVEHLARSLASARHRAPPPEDMVPRATIAALGDRLDSTLARLRAAMDETGPEDGEPAEEH